MTPDQLRLEAKLRSLSEGLKEDARTWRELEVRNALLDHKFASQQIKNDARELITAKVHAEPDVAIEEIVARELNKRPSWKQKPVVQERPAGTGHAIQQENRAAVVTDFDIDSINEKSTPAQL